MPFPKDLESLLEVGYEYLRWETCALCGLDVEVYLTPGKRELAMQPMIELLRPAIRHYIRCKIAPKQEDKSGTQGNQRQGTEGTHGQREDSANAGLQKPAGRDSDSGTDGNHQSGRSGHGDERDAVLQGRLHDSGRDAQGSGIKLYGVTDKNMIAVGWLDGTLAIQFRHGRYHYAGVPEDVFAKIRNNPFPNNMFVKLVKNHPELYTCTKVG